MIINMYHIGEKIGCTFAEEKVYLECYCCRKRDILSDNDLNMSIDRNVQKREWLTSIDFKRKRKMVFCSECCLLSKSKLCA